MSCAHSKGALGRCLVSGSGVAKDVAKGLALGRESAAAGSRFGQFAVGRCCDEGWGVAQDYAEAVRLWRLAAAQGNADAQYNLARMYNETGQGVAADTAERPSDCTACRRPGNSIRHRSIGTTGRLMITIQCSHLTKPFDRCPSVSVAASGPRPRWLPTKHAAPSFRLFEIKPFCLCEITHFCGGGLVLSTIVGLLKGSIDVQKDHYVYSEEAVYMQQAGERHFRTPAIRGAVTTCDGTTGWEKERSGIQGNRQV